MSAESRLTGNNLNNEEDHISESETRKNVKENWFTKVIKETWAFRSKITVEPYIVCYILPSVLIGMTVQNLCFHKACLVNLGYGNDTCYDIMNGKKDLHKTEETNVQHIVSAMTAWSHPLQAATPGILVTFLGAWSDRTGIRKTLMISPIIGKLVSTAGLILSTVFFMDIDVMMTALVEALPPALAGGRVAMTTAVYSYVTDITTESERTFRLGLVTAAMTLSRPIGLALSGYMTKRTGYIFVFSFAFVLFLLGSLYVALRVKKNTKRKENIEIKQNLEPAKPFIVLIINDLLATFNVAFKKRKDTRRLQIFLIMIAYMLVVGPVLGEAQLSYWFARHKFNFDEIDNSILVTYSFVVGSLGSFITIYLFTKKWRFSDILIGVIACLSRVAASAVYAVAPTRTVFYLGPVLDMFSSAGSTSLRSMATKLVSPDETGKIISLMCISEAVVTVIYTPTYSKVYKSTLDIYPGAFYFLSTGLAFVAIFVIGQIHTLRKKDAKSNKFKENIETGTPL